MNSSRLLCVFCVLCVVHAQEEGGYYEHPHPEQHTKYHHNDQHGPLVRTALGTYEGVAHGAYNTFFGVRYASVNLRFAVATPVSTAWAGRVPAVEYGPSCVQPNDFFWVTSEDCLFLNIWTPNCTQPTHPVMVFIHGGGFLTGSGNANYITGEEYAKKGVILISINYRVGLFGFFAHEELTKADPEHPTNFGLLDQILALEWVNEHIAHFGGDVNQVTVFGESAGAASLEWLLESEHHKRKPLFTKAILQSAPLSLYGLPLKQAEDIGDMYAEYIHCGVADVSKFGNSTLACLRQAPAWSFSRIRRTRNPFSYLLKDENFAPKLAAPHIDGVNFKVHPYELLAKTPDQSLANYEFIIGTNRDEYMLFMWLMHMFSRVPEQFLEDSLDMVFTAPDFSAKHQDLLKAVKSLYPRGNYPSESRRISDIISDIIFHCPAQLYAKSLYDRGANVYAYVFAHVPTSTLTDMGVYHGIELPFTFNKPITTFFPMAQVFTNTFSEAEASLGSKIISAWIQLGKTPGKLNFGDLTWPKFDGKEEEFLWMNISECFIAKFKEAECHLWDKVYPGLLDPHSVSVDIMQHEPLLSALVNGWGFVAVQHILYNHKLFLVLSGFMSIVFICYLWYYKKQTKLKKDKIIKTS
eukprot:Phypoly_transcript_05117.p1 GENE.Phypoly_transcript_05117~~Phypoly_transcript_05117.p1  ORF type:complete len:637 (-),score=53.62 Phypoly_transcript_05117:23-1933(-)